MQQGEVMPPLELYRLRDEYYVIDSHHRVAVAKGMGAVYLDAHVVELLPLADTPANTLANARSNFAIATGLHHVELTDPTSYDTMLGHISEHQSHLSELRGRPVSLTEVAEDWYREVYLPIAIEISQEVSEGAASSQFPGKTVGDLYLLLAEYKWLESERQGRDIGQHQAMLDLTLTAEDSGWLQGIVEMVVPCRFLGKCPVYLAEAEDESVES